MAAVRADFFMEIPKINPVFEFGAEFFGIIKMQIPSFQ